MSSLEGALAPGYPAIDPALFVDSKPVELSENHPFEDTEMPTPQPNIIIKGEKLEEQDEEMTDLFGNDADVEDISKHEGAASAATSGHTSDRATTPEKETVNPLEYAEEDELPEGTVQVLEADVVFPNIPVPKSSNGENWVIRMPNFVKVDSKPYHPDTYMGPEQEDDESQQAETLREKSMSIKLKVENTVRWRWIKDEIGGDRRQSNGRVIRWSDGSLSLRLGKELFDINQSIDTSAAIPRQSYGGLPNSQSTLAPSQSQTPRRSQGLTYLVAQHKRAQVLQSEALITGYMTLRPTGMQSETHRMLVRAVGQKHNKVARLRMAPDPTVDPEREVMELQKQSAKKSKKKIEDDGFGSGRRKRAGGVSGRRDRGHNMWSDDEDEEEAFAASEEEDEDDRIGSPKKKRKAADDEKKRAGEYQEDDFVVADSSEDEDGDGGGRKREKKDEDMEEDPLDQLESKIMAQEDARRRKQRDSGGIPDDGGVEGETPKMLDDEEMDVESEEEEEFKVRRTGSGARKKRAIGFDDEDE